MNSEEYNCEDNAISLSKKEEGEIVPRLATDDRGRKITNGHLSEKQFPASSRARRRDQSRFPFNKNTSKSPDEKCECQKIKGSYNGKMNTERDERGSKRNSKRAKQNKSESAFKKEVRSVSRKKNKGAFAGSLNMLKPDIVNSLEGKETDSGNRLRQRDKPDIPHTNKDASGSDESRILADPAELLKQYKIPKQKNLKIIKKTSCVRRTGFSSSVKSSNKTALSDANELPDSGKESECYKSPLENASSPASFHFICTKRKQDRLILTKRKRRQKRKRCLSGHPCSSPIEDSSSRKMFGKRTSTSGMRTKSSSLNNGKRSLDGKSNRLNASSALPLLVNENCRLKRKVLLFRPPSASFPPLIKDGHNVERKKPLLSTPSVVSTEINGEWSIKRKISLSNIPSSPEINNVLCEARKTLLSTPPISNCGSSFKRTPLLSTPTIVYPPDNYESGLERRTLLNAPSVDSSLLHNERNMRRKTALLTTPCDVSPLVEDGNCKRRKTTFLSAPSAFTLCTNDGSFVGGETAPLGRIRSAFPPLLNDADRKPPLSRSLLGTPDSWIPCRKADVKQPLLCAPSDVLSSKRSDGKTVLLSTPAAVPYLRTSDSSSNLRKTLLNVPP